MAAPIVAGEAALVRATFPSLSNKDIARHVQRMSVELDGDVQFRIDVGIALTKASRKVVESHSDAKISPSPTPTNSSSNPDSTQHQLRVQLQQKSGAAVSNQLSSHRCIFP